MENPWMAKDYFCTDRVSKGTFGEVFKAFDSTTMEYIAIKVIPIPAPITKTTARRMHREVELLQELSSHPNIIQYLGHWTEGPLSQIYTKYVSGKSSSSSKSATSSSATSTEGATSSFNSFLFIQMEFANSNLEQWIASHAKRNSEACDEIILQLLAGLAFIHEKGIIHRDLKPKNILVITCTETIQAKIGDLGLARRNNIPETGISARNVGTKLYSSPELLQGKIYDERTDVFSLALIYLELLSNIDQDGKKILFQKLQQGYMPKSLGEQMNILPEWELLQKMLTYRKENRCSAQEALKSFNLLKQEKLTETDSDSGFGQSASGTEPQSTLISSWIQPKIPVLIKSQLLFVAGIVVTLFILYLWSASVTSEPAPFIPGVALDQGCVVDKRFYGYFEICSA